MSIESEWKKYRIMVIDVDAPDIQLSECRMAFYAGAAATLAEFATQASKIKRGGENHIKTWYEKWKQESLDFRDEVANKGP